MVEIEVGISIDCHSAITSPEEDLVRIISDEMIREIDADIMKQLRLGF